MVGFLGRESKGREEFDDYLPQNVCPEWCRRDPDINTESAEEVLERRKQIDECVIACSDVFDCLRGLDVTETYRWDLRRGHTSSRMAMAANIAFAGWDGCRMTIRNKEAQ